MRHATSDEAIRRAAYAWSARMHGDDAAAHRAAFEHWRAADPRHAATYDSLERQWTQAGLLSATRVGRERALPRRRRGWSIVRSPLAAALAVVLIFVISVGGWMTWQRPAVPAAVAIVSRTGDIRTVKLADGSVVTLDTDSIIRAALGPSERRIALVRGRARFDVAHDSTRPFIVAAGDGVVVARGTMFDVSVEHGRVAVTLLRGSVDVRRIPVARATASPERVRLLPGQGTSFVATGAIAVPAPVASFVADWTRGMVSFDATPVGEAVDAMNRYSDIKIIIVDPAIRQRRITGAYRAGDTNGFGQTLAGSFALSLGRNADGNLQLGQPDR